MDTLDGKESVGVLLLADTFHEDGEVVMVVELVDLNLPGDLVGGAVLNLDGQVTTVVEAAELGGRNLAAIVGAGPGGDNLGRRLSLVQRADLASGAFTFLGVVYRTDKKIRWSV